MGATKRCTQIRGACFYPVETAGTKRNVRAQPYSAMLHCQWFDAPANGGILMMRNGFLIAVLLAGACAGSASADVVISTDPTSNMSCSGGVCSPTATDAV